MRILIDIGHPAHVHLFRYFTEEMTKKGHLILFTCRQKEFEIELLQFTGFNFVSFGKHFHSKLGKLFGLLWFSLRLFIVSIKYRPDIFLSHGSIYAAFVAWLRRKPHIAMEDSGNMEQIRLYKPFTSIILTPDVLCENLGPKQIRYAGYHELAYLHPRYFTPDIKILERNKLGKEYCIIRFVSWKATHDFGQFGLSLNQKIQLVLTLNKFLKVYITSEGPLPVELQIFKLQIDPTQIHHVLAFAELVISEGATIASEAGILGTPSIYVNSIIRSYNEDQEKYGTVFNYRSGEGVLEKALELIRDKNIKQRSINSREQLLKHKINVTSFLVWFISDYPSSLKLMNSNPEFQNRFM